MEDQEINYREEIVKLQNTGKIKITTKQLEKSSDEALEQLYKNYLAKQLDETNEQLPTHLLSNCLSF